MLRFSGTHACSVRRVVVQSRLVQSRWAHFPAFDPLVRRWFRNLVKSDSNGKFHFKRDPNRPKRPAPAFIAFSQQHDLSGTPVGGPSSSLPRRGRVLADRWDKLSAEEKDEFHRQFTEEFKLYREKDKAYRFSDAHLEYHQNRVDALKRYRYPVDPERPKFMSAYHLFIQEGSRKSDGVTGREKMSEVARRWRASSAQDRAPYYLAAEKNLMDFQNKMKTYEESEHCKQFKEKKKAWEALKEKRVLYEETTLRHMLARRQDDSEPSGDFEDPDDLEEEDYDLDVENEAGSAPHIGEQTHSTFGSSDTPSGTHSHTSVPHHTSYFTPPSSSSLDSSSSTIDSPSSDFR